MPPANKPDSISSIREGYDRWAAVYDHDRNPLTALEEPHLQRAAGEVSGFLVLDLGCGTGRHAVWLAAAGAEVTAVDFSTRMLDIARRKPGAKQVAFLRCDLRDPLPLRRGWFDLVISSLVLEHLRDLPRFFAEIHRVLRTGGRAVVTAMHPAMFTRGCQAKFTDPSSGEAVRPGSFDHQLEDVTRAVEQVGMRLEDIGEYAPDARFAAAYPRAAKYVDYPMLVILQMCR